MGRKLFLRTNMLILFIGLLVITSLTIVSNCKAEDIVEVTPTENHHVTELNSNQPYVAGFHVNTPDLNTITRLVIATAVTVSFPSADTSHFPESSWLGGGMFVQAQDSRYLHVDYGFYTTLVLDSAGDLFIDVGFHQTREERAPLHMPTEQLIYAYTWQFSGIDPTTPVTLYARWDSDGWVHYSAYASGFNISLTSVNVASLPDCENIIRYFYAGNVLNLPFPFGYYVQYFQFGIVSSEPITNSHWSVSVKNPMFLKGMQWNLVETAWSIQGDISYLDGSWMWGGRPYYGVSTQYYRNPLEYPYEIVFFYNGQTLRSGIVLWQSENVDNNNTVADSWITSQCTLGLTENLVFSFSTLVLMVFGHMLTRKKKENYDRNHQSVVQ